MITNKTISIEKISIYANSKYSNSKILFGVTTSTLQEFLITKDTKIYLNEQEANMEEVLVFFKRNKKNIAEIIVENNLFLNSINFMAIE